MQAKTNLFDGICLKNLVDLNGNEELIIAHWYVTKYPDLVNG